MTKKVILLIVLVVSVLSIIFIAVWGTLPENANQADVESIEFLNYELNNTNDKIINVKDIVTMDDPYYTLFYIYLPEDANAELSVTSSSDDVTVLLDSIKHEVLVNFGSEASIGQNVTIRITDHKTNIYDEITLIFKISDIITDN